MSELTKWEPQLAPLNATQEDVARVQGYLALTITSVDDKAGALAVSEARKDAKRLRLAIEKKRVELKEDSLKFGRIIDSRAKEVSAPIIEAESYLQDLEDRIEAERERIRTAAAVAAAKLIQERIDALYATNPVFNGTHYSIREVSVLASDIGEMTDEAFASLLAKFKEQQRIELEEEAELQKLRAEQARIMAENEAKELERIAAERKAEEERLAKEREQLEKERAELEAKQKEQEAKLEAQRKEFQAEQEKKNAELRAKMETERLRLEKEAKEREAKIRAEQEAMDKAKAEAEAEIKAAKDKAAAELIEERRKEAEARNAEQAEYIKNNPTLALIEAARPLVKALKSMCDNPTSENREIGLAAIAKFSEVANKAKQTITKDLDTNEI